MLLLFNPEVPQANPLRRDVLHTGAVVVWTLTNQMVLPSFDNTQPWPLADLQYMGGKVQVVAWVLARGCSSRLRYVGVLLCGRCGEEIQRSHQHQQPEGEKELPHWQRADGRVEHAHWVLHRQWRHICDGLQNPARWDSGLYPVSLSDWRTVKMHRLPVKSGAN